MNKPRKAIILAAGLGTRMHPLSLDTPKPLMPLWGAPAIVRLLDMLESWGVSEALVNLHAHPSPICELLKERSSRRLKINFSFEPDIAGTGGALCRAGWFVGREPFWMVNSDIAADLSPARLLADFRRRHTLASLWLDARRGPRTVEMDGGRISCFQSLRPATDGTFTFCGLQLVSPAVQMLLPDRPFFSIITVYERALSEGWRIGGVCVPGAYWADLGTPASYIAAHGEVRECHLRNRRGGALFDPRMDARAQSLGAQGVSVSGFAAVDVSARVEPGARLCNAVIWPGALLRAGAVVENAVVGSGCEVGGRVPRIAVKSCPSPGGRSAFDPQLSLALRLARIEPDEATVIPFEPRGSARSFTRIAGRGKSFIMIRYSLDRTENSLYAGHAVFLSCLGLNVPRVIADMPEHRITVIEDLGDESLEKIFHKLPRNKIMTLYGQILKQVVLLHGRGAQAALRQKHPMVPAFSADLYRWEREYFARHFLEKRMRVASREIQVVLTELEAVGRVLSNAPRALVHRDLQSSNIIFHAGRPFFIDFQGMRFGPAAYDLASLLCDPYVELRMDEQVYLLDYYNHLAGQGGQVPWLLFWQATIQRLAQALGAYAYLSSSRDTAWFARYVPPALRMMRRALEQSGFRGRLHDIIQRAG